MHSPHGYQAKFAGVRRRPYAIRPYPGTRPFMYLAKFAGVRRRPRPNLAGIPDAFSALLSDSLFAAVFGDAKSDGPVRDVKRESSEMLEQCPLL